MKYLNRIHISLRKDTLLLHYRCTGGWLFIFRLELDQPKLDGFTQERKMYLNNKPPLYLFSAKSAAHNTDNTPLLYSPSIPTIKPKCVLLTAVIKSQTRTYRQQAHCIVISLSFFSQRHSKRRQRQILQSTLNRQQPALHACIFILHCLPYKARNSFRHFLTREGLPASSIKCNVASLGVWVKLGQATHGNNNTVIISQTVEFISSYKTLASSWTTKCNHQPPRQPTPLNAQLPCIVSSSMRCEESALSQKN